MTLGVFLLYKPKNRGQYISVILFLGRVRNIKRIIKDYILFKEPKSERFILKEESKAIVKE